MPGNREVLQKWCNVFLLVDQKHPFNEPLASPRTESHAFHSETSPRKGERSQADGLVLKTQTNKRTDGLCLHGAWGDGVSFVDWYIVLTLY